MSRQPRQDENSIPGGNAAGGQMIGGKRWIYACAGLVTMLMLGLFYAWSIFVPSLEAEFGWNRSQTSLTFSISLTGFCLGGLAAGILVKKYRPRLIMIASALLIGLGLVTASRTGSLAVMHVSYGGLVGFGIGMAYNAILGTILRWFPDKLGFVSGLLLMGYGGGGMLLGVIGARLLEAMGWRGAFFTLGLVYAVAIALLGFLTTPPPRGAVFPQAKIRAGQPTESGLELSAAQMLRRPSFYLFFAWAAAGAAAGLILFGHAVPLIRSIGGSMSLAVILAGVVSASNGVSRVLSGLNLDITGRKIHMLMASGAMTLGALLLVLAVKTGSMLIMGAAFITTGLAFGGYLPAFAAVVMLFYGKSNYAMNLGLFNMNAMLASFIGPYFAGLLHTGFGSYGPVSLAMLAIAGSSLVLTFLIRKP